MTAATGQGRGRLLTTACGIVGIVALASGLLAAPARAEGQNQPRVDCVDIGTPLGAVSIQQNVSSATLTWPEVSGATRYDVWGQYHVPGQDFDTEIKLTDSIPGSATTVTVTLNPPVGSDRAKLIVRGYSSIGSRIYTCSGPGITNSVSDLTTANFPTVIPGPPTNVQGFFITPTAAEISWNPPAGFMYPSDIQLTYLASTSPGGLRCETKPPERSCTIEGLDKRTRYTLFVQTITGYGASAPSPPVNVKGYQTPPADPDNVKLLPTPTAVTLKWDKGRRAGAPKAVKYEVADRYNDGKSCTTKALTCTVRGLKPGKAYYFMIKSFAANGGESLLYPNAVRTPLKSPTVKKYVSVSTSKVKPKATLS